MRAKVVVAQDVRVSQEVLETGQERPSRGLPSWLVWTVGIAALVLLTAANMVVAGELALRSVEADNLVRAVEQSETAMKTTQADFDEVLSAYDTENLTDEEREQLRAGAASALGVAACHDEGEALLWGEVVLVLEVTRSLSVCSTFSRVEERLGIRRLW